MNNNFPTYKKIFEATQRRLKGMRRICSRNKKIDEVDELMFYLVGNINLRINTIFHLLENDITDGVLPLQRTLFELQVAFDAFTSAENEDKKIYVKFFNKKNNFETTNKLNRFFQNNNEEIKNIATPEEIELLSQLKKTAIKQIKSEHLKGKNPEFKQWYEIASGKSLKDLSAEFQEIAYYQCYDEPSNWVHPQRIIENMDFETFSQQMPFYSLMIGNIYWSINQLLNNITFLANYYNIVESNLLYEYGEKLVELAEQLKLLVEKED
ncbi:DUF5677 domain-containing protein [Bacillus mycoides]|uniref:DUF5677 domain-containing protein n=1 Tax=Bacillus mycoides TaxID=1405 RepID=UPI0024AE291B|nr:DUF5677 domain-containing protein [Bacillus mycoides]MDI6533350.1 DUF5677 domain-containing protein [Bacillus mycoides]MED1059660.1 DUF5677 domain-containing protein [Bacillus mycoides]WJE60115.1 DUF5677 domain-containing protein [Bacillus mycoides]